MKTKCILLVFSIILNSAVYGQYFNQPPYVKVDGVMEIGKYIDFHESNVDANDYSIRLESSNGALGTTGTFNAGALNASGAISANSLVLNDPNDVSDWNYLWQSGFYQGYNALNAPKIGWFWGINMNHSSNSSSYRYNGQLIIANNNLIPEMYYRSTDANGYGVWSKVISSEGTQLINGKLIIEGQISAKEVKISTTPNSDYVFEPDYELKPLHEVDQFIQENKHLPDIPSAKEFKENGVGLGEMDNMLLRKVEELTLYVIELKRENEQLKRRIDHSEGIK